MRAVTVFLAAALAGVARCHQDKELIMVEIERVDYPERPGGGLVKRQAQVQYGAQQQQQVPPEYLSLLQELSPQDQQPRDIQQVYITRSPQETYAQFTQPPTAPAPGPPRLTPEQEQMRRLQEAAANKHIREQQQKALQRLLNGQIQPGFQPQLPYQPRPQVLPQPQPQQGSYQAQLQSQPPSYQLQQTQPSYQPRPQQPQLQHQFQYEPQPQSSPELYQQTRSIRPGQLPKKFSYSQVQFGTSEITREELEPRLQTVQQSQPEARPQYYPPEPPQSQEVYKVGNQPQTPTLPQHPQQYLIETTRPAEQTEEPVVRIPRPRPSPPPQSIYYRPQSAPQYASRPDTDAPSRSAYFVHQSGISNRASTQPAPTYRPVYPTVPRIPTPQGHRPLTPTEVKALSKAGFLISPVSLKGLQEPSELSPTYEDDGEDYRTNSKRQSQYLDETKPPGKYPKRIPKPVPLTDTERRMLAEQGIRNLYRVEAAESSNIPVTYVLAIDNAVMMRQATDSN